MKPVETLLTALFHLISVNNLPKPVLFSDDTFSREYNQTKNFFRRLSKKIHIEGRSVLDVGCGMGPSCIYAGLNKARRVVGVDILPDALEYARSKVRKDYPQLLNIIEFRQTCGDLKEVGSEKFDIIISQNAFEHYSEPEKMVAKFTDFLSEDGILIIAFAPLWKSPFGGHITFMTKFPWAHLLFPESIIMNERRRLIPSEPAYKFEDAIGGLNRMTLGRFRKIMNIANLECLHFKTNVSEKKIMWLMSQVSRIPPLEEFFTHNVYSIWRLKR